MKQIILGLLLVSLNSCAMQVPSQVPARPALNLINDTDALKKALTAGAEQQTAQNKIAINKGPRLQEVLNNIVLATHKAGGGKKLIALYVFEGNENFRGAFDNPVTDAYRELGYLMSHLAQKRLESPQEKGALARVDVEGAQQISHDIRLISYAYGPLDPKKDAELQKSEKAALLADFITSLPIMYGSDIQLVIVAHGQSTDIVTRATQKIGNQKIDTLLYFQAPIYEWEWNLGLMSGSYKYHEQRAPRSFNHLYHLYSKYGWTSNQFPERKFKQQAKIENNQIQTPVKNVRAIKVVNNTLNDFTDADFLQSSALKNYSTLIDQIDNYRVNFDLLAKVYDHDDVKSVPAVAINRFVMLKDNKLVAPYGSSLVGKEYLYDVTPMSPVLLNNLKPVFSTEVQESIGQLTNITNIPATQGWASFALGSLQSDLDRIKKQYDLVLKSPLYTFNLPAAAQHYARIITPAVRTAFERINQAFNISPDYAFSQMQLGAYYMSLLLQGNSAAVPTNTQEAYMRSIISLIWYLYAVALEKNQGFEEGTFIIEDTNFVLYNFLMNYIKRFNPSVTGTLQDPLTHVSYNPFGYSRDSSHLNQTLYRHYGIDVRFGPRGGELPLLPADKRHILFGKVDQEKNLIFIKPENFGLYYLDGLIAHGLELGESKLRKVGVAQKSDDDITYRKERVPTQFLKDFDAALRESNIPDKERGELNALAKKLDGGIKTIYFNGLLSKPAIKALETKYKDLFDNLPIRIGREVIITNQTLRGLLQVPPQ